MQIVQHVSMKFGVQRCSTCALNFVVGALVWYYHSVGCDRVGSDRVPPKKSPTQRNSKGKKELEVENVCIHFMCNGQSHVAKTNVQAQSWQPKRSSTQQAEQQSEWNGNRE